MAQDLHARLDTHMAKFDDLFAKTTSALAAQDAAIAEMSSKLQMLIERSAASVK
jgi:uncharacterized coiled-coil protein SlyX